MPYLPTHTVDAAQIELVLLSMYAIPTATEIGVSALQVLTHIAPTWDDVERVRSELRTMDIPALASRTRAAERDKLSQAFISDPDAEAEVDARLRNMVREAESGLLQWRVDQLCRTARAASVAHANHHRRIAGEDNQ